MATRNSPIIAGFALCVLLGCSAPPDPQAVLVPPDTVAAWTANARRHVLLDTRPHAEYRRDHISGAIPVAGKSVRDLRQVLPVDPTVPIVVYDGKGAAPPDSGLTRTLLDYGFRSVHWLEGGLAAWEATGYGTDGYRTVP